MPSPDDRRAFVIESRVTARRQLQIDSVIDACDKQCFAALTAGERKELLRLMDKLAAQLEPEAAAR